MVSVSVLVVLGDFAVETHGMPMKLSVIFFNTVPVAKHVISSLQPDHESQSKPPPIVVPKVEIPRLPSSFQSVFGGSVASTKLPSLEIAIIRDCPLRKPLPPMSPAHLMRSSLPSSLRQCHM
eukprot:g9468.t1